MNHLLEEEILVIHSTVFTERVGEALAPPHHRIFNLAAARHLLRRHRLKEIMSHFTESVGSNNTSQKHIIGKQKREIEAFHQGSPCECLGKALCNDVTDKGAPPLPEAEEVVKWYSGKSCMTGMPPSKKRMLGSDGGASGSLNLESLHSDVSPPFVTAQADNIKLAELIDHYEIHGQLKVDLLLAIMNSPATSHSLVTSSEWELHRLLKKLSPVAYKEWCESMKP
ncbi:hypothetical protein C2S51_001782 [Perilla frutescens var. frutescens]|nr:hypothetical protein C2S51_001782 [Perilla frutescens var. frutescens]